MYSSFNFSSRQVNVTERAKLYHNHQNPPYTTPLLDTLITNKTRLKLLLRFFLYPDAVSYLRGLEGEFGESTNAIRMELNRFEAAGLLISWEEKNRKMFSANTAHPLFFDIRNILRKHTGIDTIITNVINNLGNIESAYLIGMMAKGLDNSTLELFIFGDPVDYTYLNSLVEKATHLLNREIRCTTLPGEAEQEFLNENHGTLMVWKR